MNSNPFRCQRCGNCCRWPGSVKLQEQESAAIAAHLEISEFDFIQRYTVISPDRQHLSLTENSLGHCIFLDGSAGCRINAVKPQQCRDFPNRWNFPGWERECAGGRIRLAAREAEVRHG